MTDSVDRPQRALVVTPHPDDAEIGCAGTIAKWVGQGTEVAYVLCTDGGKGSDDQEISPEELAETRGREQREAASVLGVKEVVMLGHLDGELEDVPEFRREIVRAIRQFRPDVVLCTDPYRHNSYWHRDHRIVGQVTVDAVFPYARDRLHFYDLWEREGLAPHKTGMVLMWGADAPDSFIDITDSLETKVKALLCHQSQVSKDSGRDPAEFMRRMARTAGEKAGVEYAEAFRALHFRR